VVVCAMLRRNSNLEECKKCNQHGHHALGFAEVGHIAECIGAFVVKDRLSKCQRNDSRARIRDKEVVGAKERNDLGQSQRSSKEKVLTRDFDVKGRQRRIKGLA
jgi:hypothetical protein